MLNSPEYIEHCAAMLSIPFGQTSKRPPECLSVNEVTLLLHSIDATTDTGLRHLAMLSLLYDSGCRVQELIDLNVSDFQNGNRCIIYVHGKGNKYRFIPLLRETGKVLSTYIRKYKLTPEAILFMNANGSRLTRQGVRHIIRKYATIVNNNVPGTIDSNAFPHKLRHSKASHLVTEGVNIYNVRDFLGHESVVTTQSYLTSNPEVIRKAIEDASAKTVPDNLGYYSDNQKNELLAFLDTLG